jgi:hypothetical protein
MLGPDSTTCSAFLTQACSASSPWQSTPLMFGIHMGTASAPIPYINQDVAAFLLMRGPWAWIGAGVWGMSWPVGMSFNAQNTPVARPIQMDTDYGLPVDAVCAQVSSGVFSRRWSNAHVTLDCNAWIANITMTP